MICRSEAATIPGQGRLAADIKLMKTVMTRAQVAGRRFFSSLLPRIGCDHDADLVDKAVAAAGDIPWMDVASRESALADMPESVAEELSALDEQFYDSPNDLQESLYQYVLPIGAPSACRRHSGAKWHSGGSAVSSTLVRCALAHHARQPLAWWAEAHPTLPV